MREHADLVEQIRAARMRLGLSYERLGAISGYSPQAIWWLEHRSVKPRVQTMIDITQAMNLAVERRAH
jgi:transcriptional regulator with XRE-family HTH domain